VYLLEENWLHNQDYREEMFSLFGVFDAKNIGHCTKLSVVIFAKWFYIGRV